MTTIGRFTKAGNEIDDPSMMAPFYARPVTSDEAGDHNLIWSRGTRRGSE